MVENENIHLLIELIGGKTIAKDLIIKSISKN